MGLFVILMTKTLMPDQIGAGNLTPNSEITGSYLLANSLRNIAATCPPVRPEVSLPRRASARQRVSSRPSRWSGCPLARQFATSAPGRLEVRPGREHSGIGVAWPTNDVAPVPHAAEGHFAAADSIRVVTAPNGENSNLLARDIEGCECLRSAIMVGLFDQTPPSTKV